MRQCSYGIHAHCSMIACERLKKRGEEEKKRENGEERNLVLDYVPACCFPPVLAWASSDWHAQYQYLPFVKKAFKHAIKLVCRAEWCVHAP